MANYWRLTRNPYARSVYDALKDRGITATRMYEYRAELNQVSATWPPDTPAGTNLEFIQAAEMDTHKADIDFSLPVDILDEEWVVIASIDGYPVGRTLVTDTPEPYVDPLERAFPITGVYIRKVFVVPERRGQGIASAILRTAVALARDELGADTATALIAADNKPSQGLFEGCGFKRVGDHEYARVGPLSKYRYRDR